MNKGLQIIFVKSIRERSTTKEIVRDIEYFFAMLLVFMKYESMKVK